MNLHAIIFPVLLLVLAGIGYYLAYQRSLLFFWFQSMNAGLDNQLMQILENLVRHQKIRPASKVFTDTFLLDSLLKQEFKRIDKEISRSGQSQEDYILNLYKIKQVLDLGDHSAYRISTTKDLPLFKEIFILFNEIRLRTKIVVKGKKSFALLLRLSAEDEETYKHLLSIQEGAVLDLLFSSGIMEDYHFSARITETFVPDTQHFYIELAHTNEVNSIFYRRYRQKDVEIRDAIFCYISDAGSTNTNVLMMTEEVKPCCITSISMASCLLRMEEQCTEGVRIAIMFSVNGCCCIYYGRLGKPFEKEEHADKHFVEVQFTQSTKVGLSNLGELVYEFRGSE